MSYSLSIPNVDVSSSRDDLKARVMDTAAAVGFLDIPENRVVLDRMVESADAALMMVGEIMQLDEGEVSISLSGHVGDDYDTCNVGVSRTH
jgi:hypothetical protein